MSGLASHGLQIQKGTKVMEENNGGKWRGKEMTSSK